MRSRHEVYMDGIALSSIHPSILITDIAHSPAKKAIMTQQIANRQGMIVIDSRREEASVAVSFELRVYKAQQRQEVLQKIQQWCNGKILETNDREGQRLHVICTDEPSMGSVTKWTSPLVVEFSAYEKPFWENKTYASCSMTGDDEESSLFVAGNAGYAYAEAVITPSETITELTVTVGDTTIELDDLSTSDVIKIGYDEHGNQFIKAGNTSILGNRTPASSDDLMLMCGKRTAVAVSADKSVSAVIKARGLWL